MDLIYNIIFLCVLLISITMAYGIAIRTAKNLKKGAIFLLFALITIALKYILDIVKLTEHKFNIYSFIVVFLFYSLLLMGLYQIKKSIKIVDGELTSNGKIKIKRGGGHSIKS